MTRYLLPAIALLLSGCGSASGGAFSSGPMVVYVLPVYLWEDGVKTRTPCTATVTDDEGYSITDYSACCPNGFEPVGLAAAGELACVSY